MNLGQNSSLSPQPSLKTRLFSVGTKLSAATIALMLVVTAAIYVSLSRYQLENLLGAKETAAAGMVRLFADSCAAPVTFEDAQALEGNIAMLARDKDVEYVAVWKVDDRTRVGERFGELRRGKPEPAKWPSRMLELERKPERVVLTSPVRDPNNDVIAVTTVAFSLAPELAKISDVRRRTLFISALVGLGLSVLLMGLGRALIVRPLGKLMTAARRLERGNVAEIDINSRDEIGQLANAFRSMSLAILQREERIKTRNRDMRVVLDNVGQGFITLNKDGQMLDERSRVVDEWFSAPERDMSFAAFLSRIDAKVGSWFELGWTAVQDDFLPLELCLDQLPKTIGKDARVFELHYRPVMQNAELDKVIVVITDVTARIERERSEKRGREMMSIFRHALADKHALDAFFNEAENLIAELSSAAGEDLAISKRIVHTLKGTSALFGLESIADFCHQLEDRMEDSFQPPSATDKQQLRALWQAIKDMRGELTPAHDQIAIESEEYLAFLADIRNQVAHSALLTTATSWRYERAEDRLQLLAKQVMSVAARLGKSNVDVECSAAQLRLPPRKWASFWSAFSHAIRNAVDHGIETPAERSARGQPERARVTLAIEHSQHDVIVTLCDDGRGLEWDAIAERAEQQGLPHATREDLERAVFVQGLSSAKSVTTVSGRGVGLAALQEAVRNLGGRIELRSSPDKGTEFRFIMPDSMLADDEPTSVISDARARWTTRTSQASG